MSEILCPIRAQTLNAPESLSLLTPQRSISYKLVDLLISSTVSALSQIDVEPGQKIAILGHNSAEYIIAVFALFRLGAVACPLNTRSPLEAVKDQLSDLKCRAIILDESVGTTLEINDVKSISLQSLVDLNDDVRGFASSTDAATINLDREATILFTSATTGRGKAALHSYGNHWYSAVGSNLNIPIQRGDRWLLSLPLYHVGGLAILFRSFIAGGAVVIGSDMRITAQILRDHGITHCSMVPAQLQPLLRDEISLDVLRALKCILLGGDILPRKLILSAADAELPICTSYGSTEMSSQITTTSPGDSIGNLLTAGKLLDYRELKIAPDREILVKGDTLFQGYVRCGKLNLTVDDNGWFHTADLGHLDENGSLSIVGRKDNMFISGGENIYPEEIESALQSTGDIALAVVVRVADEEFGYRPVAFVKTVGNRSLDINRIRSKLEDTLPGFKIPVNFHPWPDVPETDEMKVNREFFRKIAVKQCNSI